MKIIKPQKLGLLTRCYEHNRQFYLGVSVLAFIPLDAGPTLLSEVELWKFSATELGKDAILDAGIPKVRAEFLVTGKAFVPGGELREGCLVRVRLGSCEKLLYVYGDRYWKEGLPTKHVPFTSMPVDWAHAFGGDGYEKNPLGKGFKPVSADNETIHWLPNILYPDQRMISPDLLPEPAAFGPVDFVWPQRFSKAGTHDDVWLKEDFPGFSRDIDWTIFNMASPDQWIKESLRGDESYLIENMHPFKPLLNGRLPGIVPRCFINRTTIEGEEFEEIQTHLSTVWFFPHVERAVLIFHGVAKVKEEDAADVMQIIVAGEYIDQFKGFGHYQKVLGQRLDKENGHLFVLNDADLLPENLNTLDAPGEFEKSALAMDLTLTKNLRKKAEREFQQSRALVASYGLDPDVHGPPPLPQETSMPSLEDLPAYFNKLKAEAELKKNEEEAQLALKKKEVEKLLTELGFDYEILRAEQTQSVQGPPKFTAESYVKDLQAIADEIHKNGGEVDELEQMIKDPERNKLSVEAEKRLNEAYCLTAHFQKPATMLSCDHSSGIRDAIAEAYARGESFEGRDFTRADLSGLDLQGANFEGAFLESVNFEFANLKGANFKNAVLAHASLKGATLTESIFSGANLGAAQLCQVNSLDADFSKAILAKADLTGANFRGALLQGADCSGAVFRDTDFSGIRASQIIFLESDLRGLKLICAQLEKVIFLKVDISGVDFSGALLKSAVFLETKGKGARFTRADMTNARFVQQCDFESSIFTGALLNKANLRGSCLCSCDFTQAQINNADLSECDLRCASFYQAVASDTLFVKSDLNGAIMTSINAMNSSFQRADIRGADLRGANLFQVDLARVHADTRTQLADTLTKKVRVYPKRISRPE